MNKLVSGAIGISIPLSRGKIMLPDILDLKDKLIKHIDVCDLVTTTADGLAVISPIGLGMYLNVMEKETINLSLKDLSLDLLSLSVNNGNRLFINKVIDFPNSFITINSPLQPGYHIFLVFWFDDPKIMNQIQNNAPVLIDSFEVPVKSPTLLRIPFRENRTLYDKKFQNFFFYSPPGGGVTANGNPSVSKETSYNSFLTLQKDNYAYIRNIPIYLFYQNSNIWPLRLQNVQFDFTNSYIEIAPGTPVVVDQSYMFNVQMEGNI